MTIETYKPVTIFIPQDFSLITRQLEPHVEFMVLNLDRNSVTNSVERFSLEFIVNMKQVNLFRNIYDLDKATNTAMNNLLDEVYRFVSHKRLVIASIDRDIYTRRVEVVFNHEVVILETPEETIIPLTPTDTLFH